MTTAHPRIEKRRDILEARAADIEARMDELDPSNDAHFTAHARMDDKLRRIEDELAALDMEAADPAAHGYTWGD